VGKNKPALIAPLAGQRKNSNMAVHTGKKSSHSCCLVYLVADLVRVLHDEIDGRWIDKGHEAESSGFSGVPILH
jgi:hypothetical protein